MSRSGADFALLLLGGFRSLAEAASSELARHGFDDVRPTHAFAMRAIIAGAGNASELGRRLSVSKQAAAKTIDLLEKRGYVSRISKGDKRRKSLVVTQLGHDLLSKGEAIFNDLRKKWEDEVGAESIKKLEQVLRTLLDAQPSLLIASEQAADDLSG